MPNFRLTGFAPDNIEHRIITPKRPPQTPHGLIETDNTLPTLTIYLKQVHGGTVHLLRDVGTANNLSGGFGDGLITTIPRLPLAIYTADCVPLIIVSDYGNMAAVIHASWRSLAVGIIENAFNLIFEDLGLIATEISCAMGPCIFGQDYEVGGEVARFFPKMSKSLDNGKFLLDLPAVITGKLAVLGVEPKKITQPPLSTLREKWLPCYRREGDAAGRIETVVWIK